MQQRFERSLDELKAIVAMAKTFFDQHGLDPALRNVVDLAVEELFVNMVTYNSESSENILIEMSPVSDGIEVSLTDFNVERFDPRNVPEVDINAPLEERTPHGLGLYLVSKMVDSIHYEYKNRESRITFRKKVG